MKDLELREYAAIRYRPRKRATKYNPYDLDKPRVRLLHRSKIAEFQLDLRSGGHQVLAVERLTKDQYNARKKKMQARKEARQRERESNGTN